MDVRVGLLRKLSVEELMLLSCGVGGDSWESLGLQGNPPVILKEIAPEYSLGELVLKLKLQYFGPPDVKNWLIRKDYDAGQDWRQEEKGIKEDEIFDGITDSMDMG